MIHNLHNFKLSKYDTLTKNKKYVHLMFESIILQNRIVSEATQQYQDTMNLCIHGKNYLLCSAKQSNYATRPKKTETPTFYSLNGNKLDLHYGKKDDTR